ncbi:hypothetical protein MODO_3154 [Myroides odoratimimus]|uniref:hypothetical protein n=1 Tax=Myroides odoratimimus TaxID=76832 RepID=UPI000726EBF8|nr:hypothetical protein [Myroides odoratimimus]GAQ15458.1 hypothetical protein MODO_3154 [Myroides odoratimimus]STZ48158.1 Uncharacterised protein [Myroides odoratimimus]
MSKQKIAKVITSCNDCDHKKSLIERGGNTYFALVCAFSESQGDSSTLEPFLLNYSYGDPDHYENKIPNNCPLEDYDSNETTEV